MKNFIIAVLSAMALSMSASVFAGGEVVEAPVMDKNPAAQVAPAAETEVTDAGDAAACDADKEECVTEETAAAENTDSPVQTAPVKEGEVTDAGDASECDAEKESCTTEETAATDADEAPAMAAPAADNTAS